MLNAHKEIWMMSHTRLTYYPDTPIGWYAYRQNILQEYWATSLTKQLWATFVEGNMAWAHSRTSAMEACKKSDIDNPNQIRFSDFKDPLTDAETRKKTFTVTELKVGN